MKIEKIQEVEKVYKPKKNRIDIRNNLPVGGLTRLSEKCNCSAGHVLMVLKGERRDDNELGKLILIEAEKMAAINIWKSRFCKFKSLL